MRHLLFLVAMLALFGTVPAAAKITVTINLSTQMMHVRSKAGTHAWRVSTARAGYATPRGRYRPTLLKRMHYSRKYNMSPMPHAIFFNGGYAIHGTYETRKLGRPASHGCIRLAPRHAARLFEMVKSEGATITITGSRPNRVRQARAFSDQGDGR
jgi:lipoprotein-anchoring transpeptidase ErfK/SrfK